jgi:hypothetical protein
MVKMMRSIWIGAAVLASGASGAADGLEAQQVVDLPAEDRPLQAGFEEVYRIGSIDGDTWETFGDVAGTAFDAAGNLYVFDRQASRVTVVDRSGRFVREVGKPGDGPGELRSPMQFTVMRDGRVVISDAGHRAYQLFGVDGAFQRMVAMGEDGGTLRLGELEPHPSGDAVISGGGTMVAMRAGPGAASTEEPTTRPIDVVSLSGDAATSRVLAEGWLPPRGDPRTLEGGGLRFQMTTSGPRTFEPGLLYGALPDGGVAYTDTSTYSVKVVRADGTPARILRRPFRPVPVTERMMTAERERRLAELESGEGPQMRVMVGGRGAAAAQPVPQDQIREMMRNQIAQAQFYPELPVVQALATSWSGKIWVERRGSAPTDPGPIDVLTPTGQYQGTFATGATEIPSSFGPDGLAAFVELDDFDVPTVVVRRLPPVLN